MLSLFLAFSTGNYNQPHPPTSNSEFLAWCDQNAITISTAVQIGTGRRGRGLFAAASLDPGHVVAAVPISAMLNIEYAVTDEQWGATFAGMEERPEIDVMAAYLTYLVHGHSRWAAYLRYLTQSFSTSDYYSDAQLKALQASQVR